MAKDTKFKSGKDWKGNAKGRPRGSGNTLKSYDRARFQKMSEEEKDEFLQTIPSELRYRMAEGNPAQENKLDGELTITGNPIFGGKSNDNTTE